MGYIFKLIDLVFDRFWLSFMDHPNQQQQTEAPQRKSPTLYFEFFYHFQFGLPKTILQLYCAPPYEIIFKIEIN